MLLSVKVLWPANDDFQQFTEKNPQTWKVFIFWLGWLFYIKGGLQGKWWVYKVFLSMAQGIYKTSFKVICIILTEFLKM